MQSVSTVPTSVLRGAGAREPCEPAKMQNERFPALSPQYLQQLVPGWCFPSNTKVWREAEAERGSHCILFATPSCSF